MPSSRPNPGTTNPAGTTTIRESAAVEVSGWLDPSRPLSGYSDKIEDPDVDRVSTAHLHRFLVSDGCCRSVLLTRIGVARGPDFLLITARVTYDAYHNVCYLRLCRPFRVPTAIGDRRFTTHSSPKTTVSGFIGRSIPTTTTRPADRNLFPASDVRCRICRPTPPRGAPDPGIERRAGID